MLGGPQGRAQLGAEWSFDKAPCRQPNALCRCRRRKGSPRSHHRSQGCPARPEAVRSHSRGQTQISGDETPLGRIPARLHCLILCCWGSRLHSCHNSRCTDGETRLRGVALLPQGRTRPPTPRVSKIRVWGRDANGMSWKIPARPLLPPSALPGQGPGLSWEDVATCCSLRPDSMLPQQLAVSAWGSPRQRPSMSSLGSPIRRAWGPLGRSECNCMGLSHTCLPALPDTTPEEARNLPSCNLQMLFP